MERLYTVNDDDSSNTRSGKRKLLVYMGLSSFLFSYRARSQMKDIIYSKSSSLERKEELPAWEEAIFFFFWAHLARVMTLCVISIYSIRILVPFGCSPIR